MRFAFFQKMEPSRTMLIDFVAISDKSAAPKRAVAPAPDEVAKEEGPKEEIKKQVTPEPEKPKEPEEPKNDDSSPDDGFFLSSYKNLKKSFDIKILFQPRLCLFTSNINILLLLFLFL